MSTANGGSGAAAAAAGVLDPFTAGPEAWCDSEDVKAIWDEATAIKETRSSLTLESARMAFIQMRSGVRLGGSGFAVGTHRWTIRTSGYDAGTKTMLLGICKSSLGSGKYADSSNSGILVRGHNGCVYTSGVAGLTNSKLMFGPSEDVTMYLQLGDG